LFICLIFYLIKLLFVFTGQYQCFAENTWGTATSKSVMVVKAELNSFKDEPKIYVEAQEGDPFKLVCHPPTGWPKPNVYWLIRVNTKKYIYLLSTHFITILFNY